MAIDTVYRLQLDFDVNNTSARDTKEQEDKDQASIKKITKFIFDVSQQANLDECETGDYIFPVFQFSDKGLVPGFKEIMLAFDEDTHPMLRLGLMKAPIQLGDGVSKSPIKIMQDGAKPEEMQLAIRAAKMLGSHIAS
ncbi:TPA: hypothetical protein ACQZK0_004311 [Enterobacter mori]